MADAEPQQLAAEGAQRRRVAVLSIVAALLLTGGEVWSAVIQSKFPTIGLLQGLKPALNGLQAAAVDPRTAHEQFLVHHQVPLILASVLMLLAWIVIIVPLRYLAAAERIRSSMPSSFTGYLAQYAPLLIAIFVPASEVGLIIGAHSYLSGTARTAAAVSAATGGGVRVVIQLFAIVGQLGAAVAIILISLRAMRVGLLTRALGIIGIIAGVLFVIPLTPVPLLPVWLVFLGAMLFGFGGRPLPEAWTSGEARPWPSQQSTRAQRRPARPARGARPAPATPEPAMPRGPSPSASKKRKRRR